MKQEQYILISQTVKQNLFNRINEMDLNGKVQVKIMNTGTKSARQQGWDWQMDSDIMKSGYGYGDTDIITVHSRGKWLFAKPILIRDDEVFRNIYNYFIAAYGHDKEKCLVFARDHISTQSMSVDQVTEYLNNKFNYWIEKGVNLTDPETFKLKRKS